MAVILSHSNSSSCHIIRAVVDHRVSSLKFFGQSCPDYSLRFSARTHEAKQQTQRTLDRLTTCLPISIGYTWEGGATVDTAPIRLRDMYDNIVDIPLDLCVTPEVLYLSILDTNAQRSDVLGKAFRRDAQDVLSWSKRQHIHYQRRLRIDDSRESLFAQLD